MRITSIRVREFRRYHNLDLELAPGLTVVRGPNEAGKSTLQRVLELALTRKVTSTGTEMDALVPWEGSRDARPSIELDFTWEDDAGVERPGHLQKHFLGARGTVRLDLDGEVITDPARADEELAARTGIPSETFFRSTASVRHHELDGLATDETVLRDRLQASISGVDVGTGRARRQLETTLRAMRSRGATRPGRLKVAEDAVTAASLRVEKDEAALVRLGADRDALGVVRERRAEAERVAAEEQALLDRARQAERLAGERDRAKARFERSELAARARDEAARLEEAPVSRLPLEVLRAEVERLRAAETRVATLASLVEASSPVAEEASTSGSWRALALAGVVLLVLGVAGVAAWAAGLAGGVALLAGGVVAGLVGAVVGMGAVRARSRAAASGHGGAQTEVQHRSAQARLAADLARATRERDGDLAAIGVADAASADAVLASAETRAARLAEERARLDGLLDGAALDTLSARRSAAALEVAQKEAALEALGPIARDARARERHEAALSEARRAADAAQQAEADARARVDQNTVDAEDVAALVERMAAWREELEGLQRRERVYALALDALTRAESATMQRATLFLQRHMNDDVAAVTGGRYRRVRVDDTTLGIEVFAPERGDWVPVQSLSQGTLDVVYLAARLGLVRLVTAGGRPPLILDDPFVTLDDERGPRALELLRTISAEFQVIYLTTSARYDRLADRVVLLPGPTVLDDGVLAPDA